MTTVSIYYIAAIILFTIGLFGLAAHSHFLRKVVSLNIMAGGAFLLLISLAYHPESTGVDPVPQAMVLTGIVVTISATAFALCLVRRIREKTGQCDFKDLKELK